MKRFATGDVQVGETLQYRCVCSGGLGSVVKHQQKKLLIPNGNEQPYRIVNPRFGYRERWGCPFGTSPRIKSALESHDRIHSE